MTVMKMVVVVVVVGGGLGVDSHPGCPSSVCSDLQRSQDDNIKKLP